MKLSRIKIDNYGPIRDTDWEIEPGMTLFFGHNESGKTLLVEAIIKLLLDGDTNDFDAIDRVTGNPAGFLLFESEDGEMQVPDASFADVFPEDTERGDIRNAFVIRDFDLRLPERTRDFDHAEYLRAVTDRVLGSQTQRIDAIQEEIASIGGLANKHSDRIMDRQPEKWRSRRNAADDLRHDLEAYLAECRKKGMLEHVQAKRRNERERERVVEEIELLHEAEKRERLARGRELLSDLREAEEDIQEWERGKDEIDELRELRDAIDLYRQRLSQEKIDPATYGRAALVTAPLFAVALITTIASQLLGMGMVAGILLPIIAAILLVVLLYACYKYIDGRKRLVEGEELVEEANYAGIAGDDLPTVYASIDTRIDEYETRGNRLSERAATTLGTLQGLFGTNHDTIAEWQEELEKLAQAVEPGNRAFDADELERLETTRDDLEEEIARLEQSLEAHRERLTELDRAVHEISPADYLDDVEEVRVQSVEDLHTARDTLERFVSELDRNRDIARVAIDIFDDLADDEEQEINQLFREDDFVVETFAAVTDGNYVDVWFDEKDGIRVERADGRALSPYELSQGTYDLLYLSIRLKLAQTLLGGTPGILVLDDAFIHSDSQRAVREIEVLDSLVSKGWQIIYFSFRESVRDALEETENGRVVELEDLSFSP